MCEWVLVYFLYKLKHTWILNVLQSTEKPLLEGILSTETSAAAYSVGFSILRTADLEVPSLTDPKVTKGAFENWIKLRTGTSFSLSV